MPKYKVREGEHIMHDGKSYTSGDVITCTEEQAKMLRVDPAGKSGDAATEGQGDAGTKSLDANVTEAAARIAEMNDAKEIRRYIKGDDRKGVNDAAEARIEALK